MDSERIFKKPKHSRLMMGLNYERELAATNDNSQKASGSQAEGKTKQEAQQAAQSVNSAQQEGTQQTVQRANSAQQDGSTQQTGQSSTQEPGQSSTQEPGQSTTQEPGQSTTHQPSATQQKGKQKPASKKTTNTTTEAPRPPGKRWIPGYGWTDEHGVRWKRYTKESHYGTTTKKPANGTKTKTTTTTPALGPPGQKWIPGHGFADENGVRYKRYISSIYTTPKANSTTAATTTTKAANGKKNKPADKAPVPTFKPTTSNPTFKPTTSPPTFKPTTPKPTFKPTKRPSKAPIPNPPGQKWVPGYGYSDEKGVRYRAYMESLKKPPDTAWVPGLGWAKKSSRMFRDFEENTRKDGPEGMIWIPRHGYERRGSWWQRNHKAPQAKKHSPQKTKEPAGRNNASPSNAQTPVDNSG